MIPATRKDHAAGSFRRLMRVLRAIRDDEGLTAIERAVLRTLAQHGDGLGWTRVEVHKIARETGFCKRAVKYATASLYASGRLDKVANWYEYEDGRKKRNLANDYQVYPKLEILASGKRPAAPPNPTRDKSLHHARPVGLARAFSGPPPAPPAPRSPAAETPAISEAAPPPAAAAAPPAKPTLVHGVGHQVHAKTRSLYERNLSEQISVNLHPSSPLTRARSKAEANPPPTPPAPKAPPPSNAEGPPAPEVSGPLALLTMLCAQLFPRWKPVADRAVRRLKALNWTDDEVATYLRQAAKNGSFHTPGTHCPLFAAVTWAERHERVPPKPQRSPMPPAAPAREGPTDRPHVPIPAHLKSKIDQARAALDAAERKTGLRRPPSTSERESPSGHGEDRGGGGDDGGGEKGPER